MDLISLALLKKDCPEILVLRRTFNLRLHQHHFPTVGKETAVVRVFKQGYTASASNYRLLLYLIIFPKQSELFIYDRVLRSARFYKI